mgnify:CR=1 FL=1
MSDPDWMPLLKEIAHTRDHVDHIEFQAIQLVRSKGATWEEIGEAFGISRQAARERFGLPRRRRPRQP